MKKDFCLFLNESWIRSCRLGVVRKDGGVGCGGGDVVWIVGGDWSVGHFGGGEKREGNICVGDNDSIRMKILARRRKKMIIQGDGFLFFFVLGCSIAFFGDGGWGEGAGKRVGGRGVLLRVCGLLWGGVDFGNWVGNNVV